MTIVDPQDEPVIAEVAPDGSPASLMRRLVKWDRRHLACDGEFKFGLGWHLRCCGFRAAIHFRVARFCIGGDLLSTVLSAVPGQ
jgi:hypothetical protein